MRMKMQTSKERRGLRPTRQVQTLMKADPTSGRVGGRKIGQKDEPNISGYARHMNGHGKTYRELRTEIPKECTSMCLDTG